LALFDSGAAPYLGQVIWLEAHYRDPAMFRPAEDFTDLRRIEDLSVAGILRLLLPLLIFLLGYGAFAAERERGTLRQIMSTGPGLPSLFRAKYIAIAAVAGAIIAITIGSSVLSSLNLASKSDQFSSSSDILLRGLGLLLGYGLYAAGHILVALWVSARARSATAALLILLSFWAIANVILPRVSASIAERVYPTPDSHLFWSKTAESIADNRLQRDSDEYRQIELQVISKALGRQVSPDEVDTLELNRTAIRLEIGEIMGAKGYNEAYDGLTETYENQLQLRRLMSWLSPAIALQNLSSALSGTDAASHEHFTQQAEHQRQQIISRMNEDMMLNGAGQTFYYEADNDFWRSVPAFKYQSPTSEFAYGNAYQDYLILLGWAVLIFIFTRRAVYRLEII
jgi:ABC-2 type transport system permease protein